MAKQFKCPHPGCKFSTDFKKGLVSHSRKHTTIISPANETDDTLNIKIKNNKPKCVNTEDIVSEDDNTPVQNLDNNATKMFKCTLCDFTTHSEKGLWGHKSKHATYDNNNNDDSAYLSKRRRKSTTEDGENVKLYKCNEPGCDFVTKFEFGLSGHKSKHNRKLPKVTKGSKMS